VERNRITGTGAKRWTIRPALAGAVLATLVAGAFGPTPARAQAPRPRENIVGYWQAPLGSVHLKADGTYEGVVVVYATGQRHRFAGRYTYRNRTLTLGGERAHVHWHSENRITVTVVASPYEDFPRWQVTYTRKR
jgi:hypothetical protein